MEDSQKPQSIKNYLVTLGLSLKLSKLCRKESIHEGQENIDYQNYKRRDKDYENQDTSKEEMKKVEETENSKAKQNCVVNKGWQQIQADDFIDFISFLVSILEEVFFLCKFLFKLLS